MYCRSWESLVRAAPPVALPHAGLVLRAGCAKGAAACWWCFATGSGRLIHRQDYTEVNGIRAALLRGYRSYNRRNPSAGCEHCCAYLHSRRFVGDRGARRGACCFPFDTGCRWDRLYNTVVYAQTWLLDGSLIDLLIE